MFSFTRAALLPVLACAVFAGGTAGAEAAELSAPAAASWSTTRFDVIVRGEDGLIYQKYYDNGTWSGWGSIGAPPVGAASSPTVTTPGPNVLQVFVRGGDGYIWNNLWTNGQGSAPGGWSGWGQVPYTGNATWAPAATNGGDATPDVFYTGTDNAVWYSRYDDVNGWNRPVSLGGGVLGSPGATTTVGGRMQVAVRGTDNAVWLRFADSPSNWTGWGQIPNSWTSMSPAVTTGNDGQFNMFFRGVNDAAMYHEYYSATAGWVGPGPIPGSNLVSSPAAARLNIYQRNSSGNVEQWYYDPSWGWRGPGSIGQPSSNGRLFREAGDLAVYYMWNGTRHWVTSPEAANAFGLNLDTVVLLPNGSLSSIPRGDDITVADLVFDSEETTYGPETAATALEAQADPAWDGGASASASRKCRWIDNKTHWRAGVAGRKSHWITLRSKYCWNRTAHTVWSNGDWLIAEWGSSVLGALTLQTIELGDKPVYNVTHHGYAQGGVHMGVRWRARMCIPGPIPACVSKSWNELINYGYYDGNGFPLRG